MKPGLKKKLPEELYYKEAYDVHNCDEEPLRRIQRVQESGSLLCCDLSFDHWYYASEDIVSDLDQKSVATFLSKYLEHLPSDIEETLTIRSELVSDTDITFHRRKDHWIIEIESHPDLNERAIEERLFQESLLKIVNSDTVDGFFEVVTQEVYAMCGYDHIMVYKFDESKAGTVISELKDNDRPAYLNHKFPAGDIPEQARQLYFTEKLRVIANAKQQNTISFNQPTIEVDLSGITLRGVSPIHLEYLGNMGVQSSMSIALIKDEELWGLIVCHHATPRSLSPKQRILLVSFAEFIATHLDRIVQEEIQQHLFDNQILQIDLISSIKTTNDFVRAIERDWIKMLKFIAADTFMIYHHDQIIQHGGIVLDEDADMIKDWLGHRDTQVVMYSDHWSSQIEQENKNIGGVLAVKISPESNDYLIWIRRPQAHSIKWGGNPNESKSFNTVTNRLHPRASFESWKEEIQNRSLPWTSQEIATAIELRTTLRSKLYNVYNYATTLNVGFQEAYRKDGEFSNAADGIDQSSSQQRFEESKSIFKEDFEIVLDNYGIDLIDEINVRGRNLQSLYRNALEKSDENRRKTDS